MQQQTSEQPKSLAQGNIKSLIYERMPVRDMVKKGWLEPYADLDELQERVRNFWGWRKLDFQSVDETLVPCLTRKSSAYNQFNASYAITWYQMARNVAKTYTPVKYQRKKLELLYDEIHTYTIAENGISLFLHALNECGVTFFVLPHLQKTYLDGAAFILNENPVIVYTGRYKRIDNFWFTIAHEIAHVLVHLDKNTPFILDNLKDGERNELEDEANAMAAEKLMHKELLEYLRPYLNYLTTQRIDECVVKYKIHPSIIIGKLAFDKKTPYRNLSLFNDNVLEIIPERYMHESI